MSTEEQIDVPDLMIVPRLDTLNGGNKKLYFIALRDDVFQTLKKLGFKLDDELKFFYSVPLPEGETSPGEDPKEDAKRLMAKMNEHFEKLISASLYFGFYQKQSEVPEARS